jgi:SNF2 family DNA or RNA helicase
MENIDNIEVGLKTVEEHIAHFHQEQRKIEEKEATLLAQIAAIRLEIAQLKDEKASTRRKIDAAARDKASLMRQRALAEEAAQIQKSIDERRAEVRELLKDAPWYNEKYVEGEAPKTDVDAFKWQIDGAIQLPERALLGDKRGLGKTLSSLIWRRAQKSKKTLVCLRREVAQDFIKEIMLREPGVFVYPMISATAETRGFAAMLLNMHEDFIVVTNIESWRRDAEKTTNDIMKIDYDAVILDEAHNIKNTTTGTAQGFFMLANKIDKVLLMTGTPIKNRPQEMYALLHALYPKQFDTERHFLRDYCMSMGQNKWAFTENGITRLVNKIQHFYIARSPEDVGREVPPPKIIEYELEFVPGSQQLKAYQTMVEYSLAELTSGKIMPIVSQLALMTRQAQMVSWPAGIRFLDQETGEIIKFDIHESVKMDWAEDLIGELVDESLRVVMFSRFKPAIYEMKHRLEHNGIRVAVITGDEKGNTREIFDDFDLKTASKTDYKYDVLLATYQTVGESANFNAASHMVLYDRFWNPGNEDQAIGRIDRINSTIQATVHVPTVRSSIDVYMADLIENKRNLVSQFGSAASAQASLIEHLKDSL